MRLGRNGTYDWKIGSAANEKAVVLEGGVIYN
jgi:hypothetical protein